MSTFSVVIQPVTGTGSLLLEALGWTLEDTSICTFYTVFFTFTYYYYFYLSFFKVKVNLFVLQKDIFFLQ